MQIPLWRDPSMPEGLLVVDEYIDYSSEQALVEELDAGEWSPLRIRRIQQFGWSYGYGTSLNGDTYTEIPEMVAMLGDALHREGLLSAPPSNIIANEYLDGQGIGPHIDSPIFFGPEVVSVSLLDSWAMDFTMGFDKRYVCLLPQRSAAILSGPARYEWKHQIAHRKNDYVYGTLRPRAQRRISLTFRTVVGDTPATEIEDLAPLIGE